MRRLERGFTLLEVLLATAVAGLVVAGAYSWLWSVAALVAKADDRAQAETIASAVSRAVATEVHAAAAVDQPLLGRDPSRSLVLEHDHVDTAPEEVLVVWDPTRGVVWRNASGTYLADHVTGFGVSFRLADGRHLGGAEMTAEDWTSALVVRVDLTVTVDAAVAVRSLEAAVGPV